MYLHNFGHSVEVHAPAKLNLFLEVLARRADGYHDLETLMTAVDIFDTLHFTPLRAGDPLELNGRWAHGSQASGDLPVGSENIVVRALARLQEVAGVQQGARVDLCKRIPSSAGLGGASSDAAAALLAANRAWGLNWTRSQLAEVAAEIGSDVPFFLFGGTAICRGRGEQVTPLPAVPRMHFVVVRPPEGISTAEAFGNCQPALDPLRVEEIAGALCGSSSGSWVHLMENRLQQVASGMTPWIDRLAQWFQRFGFLGHQMSGSGSSYFGVCHHARHARRLAAVLRGLQLGHVFCTRSLSAQPVCSA
jgi:4-diphosphocytidyl-2-C-methyl-D-erythritol kinase